MSVDDRMPARIPSSAFFASATRERAPASIPGELFFGAPSPEPEPGFAMRTARTPLRFGIVLFLVGWAGILFQASFLQQVVFGAPVFEELAKFGPPLVVATLIGARSLLIRMPLAWASGAGFGIFEHYVTYPEEDVYLYAGRVLFHAASAGLSMLFFTAFDEMADVRARWASTAVPTLFHWANNFGAVVFAFGAMLLPAVDVVALVWSGTVTALLVALTLVGLAFYDAFGRISRDVLLAAIPRLRTGEEGEPEPGPTTSVDL